MVNPPADIFSFGVIAYELLSGELPFRRPLPGGLPGDNSPRPAPPPLQPAFPELAFPASELIALTGLLALLERCLNLDPAKRPTLKELLAAFATPPGSAPAV